MGFRGEFLGVHFRLPPGLTWAAEEPEHVPEHIEVGPALMGLHIAAAGTEEPAPEEKNYEEPTRSLRPRRMSTGT